MNTNKLVKISLTANLIEWYEFIVSAYLATIMGHVFFNNTNQSDILAAIQFFSIFALSYLIRPIGCIFWGIVGDIYGSGKALRGSLIVMTIPTFIIGILPSYSQAGAIATILFLMLKLMQGFAAGGEFPLSSIYVFDKSLQHKRANVFCSFVNSSGMVGMLLASLTITVLNISFNQEAILAYAWRIPFLLGLPLSLIIVYIRNSIDIKSCVNNKLTLTSKQQLITSIIKTVALIAFLQINMYVLFVWFPTYLITFLHVDRTIAHVSNMVALIALTLLTLTWGYIGSIISYRKVIPFCILSIIVFAYPCFYLLLSHQSEFVIYFVQIYFAFILSPLQGTFLYAMNDLFGRGKRSLVLSLSYTIPSAVFGGLTPVLCSYFILKLNLLVFPGVLIAGVGTLALFILIQL